MAVVTPGAIKSQLWRQNLAAYLQSNNLYSALAVSNYYHLPRTRLAFQRAGIETVYTAHASHFELRDFYSVARELIAYPYYFVRKG